MPAKGFGSTRPDADRGCLGTNHLLFPEKTTVGINARLADQCLSTSSFGQVRTSALWVVGGISILSSAPPSPSMESEKEDKRFGVVSLSVLLAATRLPKQKHRSSTDRGNQYSSGASGLYVPTLRIVATEREQTCSKYSKKNLSCQCWLFLADGSSISRGICREFFSSRAGAYQRLSTAQTEGVRNA